MKALIIAGLATALACGAASAQTTGAAPAKDTTTETKVSDTIKVPAKKHAKVKRSMRRADGYYAGNGIPKNDPGRYSNLPGKDSLYSKSYIQDH